MTQLPLAAGSVLEFSLVLQAILPWCPALSPWVLDGDLLNHGAESQPSRAP